MTKVSVGAVLALCSTVAALALPGCGGQDRGVDPTLARRSSMKAIVRGYFDGLAKRDVSAIPYDATVELRTPLAGPCAADPEGGADCPLVGAADVRAFLGGIASQVGGVTVRDVFLNDDLTIAAVEATIKIVTPAFTVTVRANDTFTISDSGKITAQENHFDPRPVVEPHAYKERVRGYFTALATGTAVDLERMYAEDVHLRAPIAVDTTKVPHPYGAEIEVVGKANVVALLSPLLPAIDTTNVKTTCMQGNRVCVEADIGLPNASAVPRARAVDCFDIDPRTGLVSAQENHFDPRVVMPPCSVCGGKATAGCFCPP
jgi:ketosteroid isomerase-like protein